MKLAQHVLLIDDNPDCNFIMGEFIRMVDGSIHVVAVESAIEGLQHLEKHATFPEVIFVDINMPILDGFGFVEAFQTNYMARFPQTRLYMLSSSVRDEDFERAKRLEAVTGFMSKSNIDDDLRNALTFDERMRV